MGAWDIVEWTLFGVIFVASAVLLWMVWAWFIPARWKGKKPKSKLPPTPFKHEADWHKGKHFGTVFWHPKLRCNCVVLQVVDRDTWYYAPEKTPEQFTQAEFPVNRIAGELK